MDVIKAVSSTSLEYTAVYNGLFLDYFVAPKVKTYLYPLAIAVDIANNTAAIPGSGDYNVVFTHTTDVAKYVVALLSAGKWETESFIIGDKVTINEFVKIAEAARGLQFTITHDEVETLEKGQITELPSHPKMYPFFPKHAIQGMFSAFGRMWINGTFDFKPSSASLLNERFPDIRPRSVRELINEAWKA